ncbi:4-hydroxy-tetrahydrodipicolinate reductase [Vulcanibacillus modesticaldus]|uniref:4-hydroxy-tetrahydrodipicolinate reductase n=1 Tax=Vulcanibacillus modesticaldus TaxID=337097 RepID=A0A1D2YXE8_9BACI|nr:4-hydroxy-tetrahydrodipicolinate reductase [Vulcanibacillus modesticaldus]OEG00330.1 4-hydroxy-tetrahydrodipicolinate reductase [Vulcanibacillus modesticaldus]
MSRIRVMVAGANGRMGRQVVQMVLKDKELEYLGGIDPSFPAENESILKNYPLYKNFEEAIIERRPDVVVDFTTPQTVKQNTEIALRMGVSPVIGTTGLTYEEILQLDKLAKEREIGGIVAPNFAIGAVLMMRFAQIAAKYMPNVEIIEMHHDQKLDAPSGTAIKTAELIARERKEILQGHQDEKEIVKGSRGGEYSGFRIHSVRLPGLVAHQQVIFGDQGQTLTIRHDSINRESFMPGVNLAIKRVRTLSGIVYGLEHLLD